MGALGKRTACGCECECGYACACAWAWAWAWVCGLFRVSLLFGVPSCRHRARRNVPKAALLKRGYESLPDGKIAAAGAPCAGEVMFNKYITKNPMTWCRSDPGDCHTRLNGTFHRIVVPGSVNGSAQGGKRATVGYKWTPCSVNHAVPCAKGYSKKSHTHSSSGGGDGHSGDAHSGDDILSPGAAHADIDGAQTRPILPQPF